MQTTEEEIDTSKALDASLVNTESSGTDLESMIQAAFRNMYDADGFNNQTRNMMKEPNVTRHYLPKERESVVVKPHHMIAPNSSRYSSKDMVHNHYLEEAKKKTQECSRNSRPSVMPSARSQSTANGSKPKPRINNQKSRNWPTCTSINVQEEQTLDLNAGTPFNLKNERIKVWIKENVISGRPRLHGITLIQEICARLKSQGIR
ncbi:hypothetical protein Tco_0451402 [Tanacetum coccineum]